MYSSYRARAAAGAPGPVEQDVGVPADAAGHEVRALHRRAVAGAHHARGAARLPRPQHRDAQDGRADHRQHVLAHRPEGPHALPAQHYTGAEELLARPRAGGECSCISRRNPDKTFCYRSNILIMSSFHDN